ncbi:exodeoxyribonuclease III [Kaistia dalseonensis]|uniref:Exodeoxyribonuclease-3 n=1 Tax=Kaistia dalseonensis TaxID=410840 RepID=A0ABU0H4R4_9HYPH|nr:exodeoxyribonuclease III [Kaistia dalseonensis]MCX5494719.1 exodeoxyribonuclease III [Kaistia dalseonensis]MDQ0437300.1 exodeoxyribonuclease-3 [Kaistia dalseonensis]
MTISIATWNINSVRLRIDLVTSFLEAHRPDILCLQEIKCIEGNFPAAAFKKLGYTHQVVHGQKGYHGVATVARVPFIESNRRGFCGKDDARHVSVTLADREVPITLHNFYVPAGGDEPDPAINEKFAHKLGFLDEMRSWLTGAETNRPAILVGDLNIAPLEQDVWSHKQLLNVVSHTPVETEKLEAVRAAGGWVDAMRQFVPADQKLYTWWSYRAQDWEASDRGRRLDHVWVTPPLRGRLLGMEVIREARGWNRPSDHVPVIVKIAA